jgi:hypothetical protein
MKDLVVELFKELQTVYGRTGWEGFLAVASAAMALLTVVFAFFSGQSDGGAWHSGITFEEEILFVALAALFAVLGLVLRFRKLGHETALLEQIFELERALVRASGGSKGDPKARDSKPPGDSLQAEA